MNPPRPRGTAEPCSCRVVPFEWVLYINTVVVASDKRAGIMLCARYRNRQIWNGLAGLAFPREYEIRASPLPVSVGDLIVLSQLLLARPCFGFCLKWPNQIPGPHSDYPPYAPDPFIGRSHVWFPIYRGRLSTFSTVGYLVTKFALILWCAGVSHTYVCMKYSFCRRSSFPCLSSAALKWP